MTDDFDRINRISEDPDKFRIGDKHDHVIQRKPKKKKEENSFKEELLKKEREAIKEEERGIKPSPPPPHGKYKDGKRII